MDSMDSIILFITNMPAPAYLAAAVIIPIIGVFRKKKVCSYCKKRTPKSKTGACISCGK
jgi:hypothetical protein